MSRLSIVFVLAALAVPAAALGKGPSEASISGPGFAKQVNVPNDGSGGAPGGDLTQESGFFPAAFGQSPDPMLHRKASGPLGPRYRIVWTVPGGGGSTFHIRQQLYPYARGGSVTYMRPGQPIFDATTAGGWYRNPELKRTLMSLGLPARRPSSTGTNWALIAALGAVATATITAAGVWRRRSHKPVPAAQQPA